MFGARAVRLEHRHGVTKGRSVRASKPIGQAFDTTPISPCMVADSSEANGAPINANGFAIAISWEESTISEKRHAVRLDDELPASKVCSVENALNLCAEGQNPACTEGQRTLRRVLYANT